VTRLRIFTATTFCLFVFAVAAGTAQAAIKVYESSEAATFLGEVRKAKCKVKRKSSGKVFRAGARTTNGAYTLDIAILDFKGFGKEYNVAYGQISTTVDFEATNSSADFSNAYPFPGGQPPNSAGTVAFHRGGDKVGVGVYALPNADYSQGVVLAGGMKCAYPR
jgi:hypothetical protein